MNINQNSVGRREASSTPSPQERTAMRATRDQVRTDETTRRDAAERRPETARPEAARETRDDNKVTRREYIARRTEMGKVDRPQVRDRDRVEISSQALRRSESTGSESTTRREAITSLKEAYQNGELSTSERRRIAASQMLGKNKA